MKEFIEKWNSDSRFKTKIKLSLYTLFVVLVAIFAISSKNDISENQFEEEYNQNKQEQNKNINNIIEIPNKYNYKISININEKYYQYTGTKENQKESITKEAEGVITNYINENNNYYKEYEDSYILTTKEDVYDIVNYNYLKLETINEYLSKSVKRENEYLVYLKDIILGNGSEDYIIITKEDNIINVDYTELMKNFDKTIENYSIKIEIE